MTFTTASGLLPAGLPFTSSGAERSRFGNGTSGWTVRLYVSKGARPIAFTTASLGRWHLVLIVSLRNRLFGFS